MTTERQPQDADVIESELAAKLAEHEVDESVKPSDSTLSHLRADLDTLASNVRKPLSNEHLNEPALQSGLRALVAIGRDPDIDDTVSLEGVLADENVPTEIGAYELLQKLGSGGMGTVFKARHKELGKLFAVKLLRSGKLSDKETVARFHRERRVTGQVDHPNLVNATDAGEDNGHHYLVMELLDGVDLSKLGKQYGQLPIAETCELIRQAALGLQHAHELGLVHRDIKPSNMMLTPGQGSLHPTVKVLDLGLAILSEPDTKEPSITSNGQLLGTFDYLSPDQASNSRDVDIRTDIYSLGATMYRLLTGIPPFPYENYGAVLSFLSALANDDIPPIQSRRQDIPSELAAIVHRMVEKNRDDRYSTPQEVVEALAPFCEGANLAKLLPSNTEAVVKDARAIQAPVSPDNQATQLESAAKAVTPVEKTVIEPSTARKRSLLTKLLPAAAILLAAIFILTTKQGTVVVEFPKDAQGNQQVPASLKVVLQSDSKTINISSKDDWEINASPDNYEIQITGASSDEFKFTPESATLTVSRFGNTLLKLTRQTSNIAKIPNDTINTTPLLNKTGPFWQLRREDIDPYELKVAGMGDPAKAPKELVAILGDSRMQKVGGIEFTEDSKQIMVTGFGVEAINIESGETERWFHGQTTHSNNLLSASQRDILISTGDWQVQPLMIWQQARSLIVIQVNASAETLMP